MTNKRIKVLAEGVTSEALSDTVILRWNPINETASLDFISGRYLKMGEDYISRIESDSTVSISMEQLHEQEFHINGKQVSGTDLDMFIRLLYDKLYNEQIL